MRCKSTLLTLGLTAALGLPLAVSAETPKIPGMEGTVKDVAKDTAKEATSGAVQDAKKSLTSDTAGESAKEGTADEKAEEVTRNKLREPH